MALIEAQGTNGLQLTQSFKARTWTWKGNENGLLSRGRVFCLQRTLTVIGGCAGRARGWGAVWGDGGRVSTPRAWRLGRHGEYLVGLLVVPGIDLMR